MAVRTLHLVPQASDDHRPVPPRLQDPAVADRMLALIDDYTLFLRAEGKSPETIRLYILAVRRFLPYAVSRGAGGWEKVGKKLIVSYLAGLEDQGISKAHVSTLFYGLRSFFSYLAAEEGIPSPMTGMKGRRVQAPPVDILRQAELTRLVESARKNKDPYLRVRDEAMIRLMIDTGCRLHECSSLGTESLELGECPRVWVDGKTGPRSIAIGSRTALALRRYIRARASHPSAAKAALWLGQRGPMADSGVYKVVRDAGLRAGFTVHPHQLRHSYAHNFRASGGELDELVHQAGWSGPAMALRYGRSALGERAEATARRISLGDKI